MTLDELDEAWASVALPSTGDGISGRRAVGLPRDKPIYLAVDGRGHRHLLVQVPDNISPLHQRETRSLEVLTAKFAVGNNPEYTYVDLVCTDASQHPTFSAVAQDMIRAIKSSVGPLRDSIVNALSRWRTFWTNKSIGLSREEALGLFGELWFLRRWLGQDVVRAVARWQVTEQSRHDFQWTAVSVEVKTAAGRSGDPIHHITSLDQLENPLEGRLFLFSLQVCDDALATNTLHSLVEVLTDDLRLSFQALTMLNEKLAARGYTPADRLSACRQLRILTERLYEVVNGFPRIIRSTFHPAGLPTGVGDVGYSIDMAACRQWLVADAPSDAGAELLKS